MPSDIDEEWELAWAEYDQRFASPGMGAAAVPGSHLMKARLLAAMTFLGLALGAGIFLAPAVLTRRSEPPPVRPVPPRSLAPHEADLPPLSEALDRLSVDSAAAACWAARLQPGGATCEARPAPR